MNWSNDYNAGWNAANTGQIGGPGESIATQQGRIDHAAAARQAEHEAFGRSVAAQNAGAQRHHRTAAQTGGAVGRAQGSGEGLSLLIGIAVLGGLYWIASSGIPTVLDWADAAMTAPEASLPLALTVAGLAIAVPAAIGTAVHGPCATVGQVLGGFVRRALRAAVAWAALLLTIAAGAFALFAAAHVVEAGHATLATWRAEAWVAATVVVPNQTASPAPTAAA
ncbi:MAG: hypothetical protein AAF677_14230, partial [Pseudomonadota bacterium]